MTRVGTGVGYAPYFLFIEAARDRARRAAEDDLSHRLQADADLIACPKCKWVNERFVLARRRSSYGSLTKAVVIIWAAATFVMVFVELANTRRVPRDTEWLWLIARCVAYGAIPASSIFLLQFFLRRRIGPNRYLPV